jgi:Flp pilus assembly pilin Flp
MGVFAPVLRQIFGGKMKKIRQLLKNEKGQGMLEYVLLAGVIVTLMLIFKDNISKMITGWTGTVQSQGDKILQ